MEQNEVTTSVEPVEVAPTAELFFDNSPKETVVEKPAEEVPKEDKPKEDKPAEEVEKPAEELSLKLPDGAQIEQSEVDEILALAKENNLTQEQAQKIVDARANSVSSFVKRVQDKHEAQIKQWGEAIKTDKEMGGDKYAETVALAKRAVEKYASPELKKALDDSGYGNHPELVRVFARFGKTIADPKLVNAPGGKAAKKETAESLFYPSMNQV